LSEQRALSNAELLAQRAEQDYQLKVNQAFQEYEWEPWQKREVAKVSEQKQKILSRSDLDQAQKTDGIRQLETHQRDVVGFPRQRKQFPTIDEQFATGQSKWITDPVTGARAIASFDRNGAPRYTFVPDKQAQANQEQTREFDAQVKGWERQLKYQEERRKWIDQRVNELFELGILGEKATSADARRLAAQEVDSVIPPPPEMAAPREPGQSSIDNQPQDRGLPPMTQAQLVEHQFQVGAPMGAQSTPEQTTSVGYRYWRVGSSSDGTRRGAAERRSSYLAPYRQAIHARRD
jgi:hypothetical protein